MIIYDNYDFMILLEIFPFRFIVGPRIRTPGLPVYDTNRLAHKARHANHSATLTTTKIVGRVTVI